MAGSSFGTIFRITTWGESHGKGIGVVVDGCPAGIPLTEDDIQPYLDLRKPGQNRYPDLSARTQYRSAFQGLWLDFRAVSAGTRRLYI